MLDRGGYALAESLRPTIWTYLLGGLTFTYYAGMWSLCLLGRSQARHLFGKSSSMPERTSAAGGLPLRHEPTPVPGSPLSAGSSRDGASSFGAKGDHAENQVVGVSILRPLAGLDHNLANNLASAFEQRYPMHLFEIILSVRDENDQALSVARTICARYPDVRSRIIIGDEPVAGVNPKIANLVRSYAAASFDIVWVLDSQVHVSRYALARAVHALNSAPRPPVPQTLLKRKPHGARVGLVHHVPLGVTPLATSFGSLVEAIFFGTNHAKMYLAINALSLESCVMGKSNMYRKSDLAQVPDAFFKVSSNGTRGEAGAIGSIAFEQTGSSRGTAGIVSSGEARPLARFGIYLAEDNMLATALWKEPMSLGHTLLPTDVARTSVADVKTIHEYWQRRVRWIRVRRHMVPSATFIEPFTESIACGIIAAYALLHCWLPILGIHVSESASGSVGVLFFAVHWLLWHLVDFSVLKSVQNSGRSASGTIGDDVDAAAQTLLIDFGNHRQVWQFRLAWLGRELLAFPIWLVALFGNTVEWRGRRYQVLSDGRAAIISTGAGGVSAAALPIVDGWLPRIAVYLGWDGKRKKHHGHYERLTADRDVDA